MSDAAGHYLIIESRYYVEVADELLAGATEALEAAGATWDKVNVPGALEMPAALSMAVEATAAGRRAYAGYILLGCVIRGETSHYDIVAGESARAAIDLSVRHNLAMGNGILTVDNRHQALARARRSEKNKGGDAARAALAMAALKAELAVAC